MAILINKKFMILAIFLVSLLAVSAVSAADNATEDIVGVEETADEVVSVNENQTILSENNDVGTFDDLQGEINNAAEGSVLNLTRDYNGAHGSRIQLNKNTIDGQGHTLDCLGDDCSAFYSNSGTITLQNIKIINGHNDFNNKGGAIYIEGSAQYTIINCTFNNNWADDYGGAIYNGVNKPLTIINSSFNNNKADDDDGGAIYSKGELDIINSTFTSNNANDDGGAIYCEKSVYLENCLFEKNHANVDGGAIYSKSNVTVTKNTRFNANEAKGATSAQCYGGAIRSEGHVKVDHATFTENIAADSGGAIYAKTVYIFPATFKKNKAEDNDGGAVCAEGSVFVRDSSFEGGRAYNFGAAIYTKDTIHAINTYFWDNRAVHGTGSKSYGGAVRCEGDGIIEYCRFSSNYAFRYGGAIYCDGDLDIKNTLFKYNEAHMGGGAVYCEKYVSVENSEFIDSKVEDFGGAIYCEKDVSVKNTKFTNNEADDHGPEGQGHKNKGGAILSEGDVKIDGCTFNYNHAQCYGGAIYADTITWVDTPSYFKGNHVYLDHGGTIYVNKFTTDVKYGVFIDGDIIEKSRDGGAIYINKENHITFSQCYFEHNRCTDEGGAIYLDSTSSTLTLENNIFISNWAKDKGNIVYNKGEYTKIHNNWYGSNSFDFSNELVEYNAWGSDKSHQDDEQVIVELSLDENPQAGQPSTLIVRFISDGELFNYDAKFSADNGAILTNHKIGNNTVTSDITFDDGITTVTATVNKQVLKLSYSYSKQNVTMDIKAPEITFGDNAAVNVIITPNNATGKVSIGNINSPIVNGAATLIIPDLSAGDHTLLVSYSGDGVYKAKQENVTIAVNRKNLNVDASAKPIVKGENATVIVTGLERATGNVTVTINNNHWTGKISNGTATIIIPGLNDNTTANVTYIGDANYTNASTAAYIIVYPIKVNLTISASVDPIMASEDAIIVVSGLENATGSVTVTIGSDEWYGEINNGVATVTVTGLKMNATADVFYPGDYLYNNASTTVDITVTPTIYVWYVNGSKESSGNGITPDTAFKTLKEALKKAPENSTIYIAPGTYTGKNNTNLAVNKNLTFANYGVGEAIFDAQGLSRIWTVNAGRINITGLTFKNGKQESVCGAIFFSQTLNDSCINAIFINNNADEGLAGAIGFYADVINTNINSIFINNSVNTGYGGAIFFNGNLNNVNISGNYTANTAGDYGGAILFYGDLNNVDISGNYTANSAADGGAIFFNGNLADVNISGYYNNNQANDTAGVFLFNSNLTNVVISGDYSNNAAQYCAVYYMSESATVNDSSISGDYYNNSANYCVVLLMEGIISNSNISGNYTNNHAEMGINIIGKAYNVDMSGSYVNNDIVNGSVIYIMHCNENSVIHDSVFINNTMDDNLIIDVESGSVSSVNNWFGNNATNYNIRPNVSENVTMVNWLFLNATTNTTDEMKINETAEIAFKLYSYDNVSQEIKEYDASKMNIQLDLSPLHGTLNQPTAFINETILFKCMEVGLASVTGQFETASYTIILTRISTEIIVNKTEITLNVSESVSAGAALNPPEAGNLTYTSTNTSVAVVENGIIKGLKEGTAIITVSFAGDERYAPAVSNITVDVVKRTPVIIASADVIENRVIIRVDIDEYDGVISLNSIYLKINSSISFVEILDPGSYSINITAWGNDLFYPGSEILNFTVPEPEKLNTSISAQPSVDGNSVTITVDVDLNATGFVEIAIAGNKYYIPVDAGKAVFTNEFYSGTYSADITYLGDNKYNPANTTAQFSVIDQNDTLKNTSIKINVVTGENYAMFTVDVNESATGLVEINIDGEAVYLAVKNGQVTYEAVMPGGDYTVTATYLGDDRFNGNSTTSEFTVKDHEKINTTIATSVSVANSTVTLTVNVNENATGFVEISVAGKKYYVPVDAGKAVFSNDYAAGTYGADITYLGDDNFNAAVDSASFTVIEHNETKMNTAIDVEVDSVENNVTITVNVNENATGLVEFNIDGEAVYLPVNNGVAVCGLVLSGGDYTVTATYMGDSDSKFNSNSTSREFTVKGHEKVNTTIATSVGVVNSTVTLTVNVNENATGFVEISVAGKKYYVPVDAGKAVFSNDYAAGTYGADITYLGDDNFNAAVDSASFTVIEHNVTKKDTPIDISVDSIENNVTITVNVDSDATGCDQKGHSN